MKWVMNSMALDLRVFDVYRFLDDHTVLAFTPATPSGAGPYSNLLAKPKPRAVELRFEGP